MKKASAEVETKLLVLLREIQLPNQKQLAAELGVSPPTVRQHLWKLEGQKLVERDETRLPHIMWKLTPSGEQETTTRAAIARGVADSTRQRVRK